MSIQPDAPIDSGRLRRHAMQTASDAQLAINKAKGLIDVQITMAATASDAAVLSLCPPEQARGLTIDQADLERASTDIKAVLDRLFAGPMTIFNQMMGE